MATCGMYDGVGRLDRTAVGLPAKSGVSGGIMAVVPGQLGIASLLAAARCAQGTASAGVATAATSRATCDLHPGRRGPTRRRRRIRARRTACAEVGSRRRRSTARARGRGSRRPGQAEVIDLQGRPDLPRGRPIADARRWRTRRGADRPGRSSTSPGSPGSSPPRSTILADARGGVASPAGPSIVVTRRRPPRRRRSRPLDRARGTTSRGTAPDDARDAAMPRLECRRRPILLEEAGAPVPGPVRPRRAASCVAGARRGWPSAAVAAAWSGAGPTRPARSIVKRGDPAHELFLLTSGRAERHGRPVGGGGPRRLTTRVAGTIFGELAFVARTDAHGGRHRRHDGGVPGPARGRVRRAMRDEPSAAAAVLCEPPARDATAGRRRTAALLAELAVLASA